MLKITVILFLVYLSIETAKSQNNYEVTGLKVLNSTKDSLEIGWTLPLSSDYDKFEISYIVVDTRANQTIDVSKDSSSFLVSDLQPGSTLLFYVNTFKGGSSVASVYFSPTNKLDDVGNAKVINIGEVSVTIEFDLPKGYYSGIVIVCYPEDDSLSPELNNVGKGINQVGCYFLTSGSTITVAIFVYKGDINSDDSSASDGTFFRIRTLLSQSTISYCEISSNEVNVTLTAPSGYFDYLEFDLILLDTDSQLYYVDKSKTRPECAINRTITVGNLTADLIQNPIVISGLCPTSFWNGTVRTVRDGFDSVDSSLRYRNTYENVDCSLANLSTVGPITTFYWPNSEMKVDLYYVAIYLGSTNVTQATIPFGNNSWTVNGLENNKDYTFNISVRNSNKNITSMACLKTLKTGDPCSKYDDNYEVDKFTAPYPDNIQLMVPNKIFTSTGYIKKLTVLVGTSSACENETQADCYISTYIDVEDFYNGTNDPYIAVLPPVANCYNNKCSLKFVLDQNYYFSVMGDGPCGKIASNAAVFNVPSPFPLATIIGSVVGASVFLVLVLLGVIIVLTLKHIKKKHHEELSKLIDKPKYIYYEEPALTSF